MVVAEQPETFPSLREAVSTFRNERRALEISQIETIQLHDVADMGYGTPPVSGAISVVGLRGIGRYALAWDRHQLVQFAKQVLRRYEPTAEDEILASLKRIEEQLRGGA